MNSFERNVRAALRRPVPQRPSLLVRAATWLLRRRGYLPIPEDLALALAKDLAKVLDDRGVPRADAWRAPGQWVAAMHFIVLAWREGAR